MEPNQKLPFPSSKTEKKRAELTLLVILVKDFPSYRKIPSNAAIQMLPFVSCIILRVIHLGPWEVITPLFSGVSMIFFPSDWFCAQEMQKTSIRNKAYVFIYLNIFY